MFWRAAWVADFPDPQNFLNLFYGGHVPEKLSDRAYMNPFRYKNPDFDVLFEEALKTVDVSKRMELLAKADQILIDDAVIMPIYYDNYIRLVKSDVVNFPINQMEHRDFSRVFFKKPVAKK
jgi:peptide/nickel transport system substrate-binding protein